MRISKLTPLGCALALSAVGFIARADDNPAQAAARAALAKELSGVGETQVTNAPATNAVSGENARARAKAEKAAKEHAQKEKQKAKQAAAPAQPAAVPQPAPATGKAATGEDLGLKQMPAPALPISASKESRLQALLQKYMTDQLTPEEYHQQRAAILAEP